MPRSRRIATFNHCAEQTGEEHPSGLVYHYANAQTFKSILDSREIRATSLVFMNDAQEVLWGLNYLLTVLEEIGRDNAASERSRQVANALASMSRSIQESLTEVATEGTAQPIDSQLYASCFSYDGDSLDQWRAYVGEEVGFAIGFDPKTFKRAPNHQAERGKVGFIGLDGLRDVEYFAHAKYAARAEIQRAKDHLARIIPHLVEEPHPYQEGYRDPYLSQEQSINVWLASATIKSEVFESESECRLLIPAFADLCSHPNKTYGLTPYYPVPFNETDVRAVVIGPTAHKALARNGVMTFLANWHNEVHIHTCNSLAPFRNW